MCRVLKVMKKANGISKCSLLLALQAHVRVPAGIFALNLLLFSPQVWYFKDCLPLLLEDSSWGLRWRRGLCKCILWKQNKNKKKNKQNQKPKNILCKLMERKIIILWVCICVVCLILSHSSADCSFSQLLFQECCIEPPPTQWLNTLFFPYASVCWLGIWLSLDPGCGWAPSLLPCALILWTV